MEKVEVAETVHYPKKSPNKFLQFLKQCGKQHALLVMTIPFLIWLFIFKYLPIWGWTIAFQNYRPSKSFAEQEWVGFQHFAFLFEDERFLRVLRNTLAMSGINLVLGFVTAIALALLLNEVRVVVFKTGCTNDKLFASLYFLGCRSRDCAADAIARWHY